MGCCSSKPTPGKEYAATTPEVAPFLPFAVSARTVIDNAVEGMCMDRGDEVNKVNEEEPQPEDDESASIKLPLAKAEAELDEVLVRSPESAMAVQSPPADDIPISSTYHRVHSAEVAEQEKKWQEEQRLEAERREREVQEYKAATQIA
ncbi:hypothetical protein PInf_024180 [Phytophthora infestans]|nr:hypothetical protein PInf_024180 [Phytophthora infestans]